MQTKSIRPRRGWLASNWQVATVVVIVIAVAASALGLIYTQPWSKIRVTVYGSASQEVEIRIKLDGVLKATIEIAGYGGPTIVTWSVRPGAHTVSLDYGYWSYYVISVDPLVLSDLYYNPPDDEYGSENCHVDPLSTKNVHFSALFTRLE